MNRMMRAVVLTKTGPVLQKVPVPQVAAGEVLVRIEAAAFNRRDYWITQGKYPGIKFGGVMGSDACGKVVEPNGSNLLGRRVIVNPTLGWEDPIDRGDGFPFDILGLEKGTFADYIAMPETSVFAAPDHLSVTQAAALPLAGLTAYRAVVTKGEVKSGQTVLVTGAGSGVASLAVQFAAALGAKVLVTSSSPAKIERAKTLGASGGFIYTSDSWTKEISKAVPKGVDVVIDGGGGDNFAKLLRITRMGGKVVVYGATAGTVHSLDLPFLFLKQISILGTSMGSTQEFGELVKFVEQHKIVPTVESVLPLEQFSSHFATMEKGDSFGKLVLTLDEAAKL